MIVIADYGAGNLRSVQNALTRLGVPSAITADPDTIDGASGVILPGVGSFGWAVDSIRRLGLESALVRAAGRKPFLGICLGYQLLFDESCESPGARGLGVEPGRVVRFPQNGQKVPHMGWNHTFCKKPSRLFAGIPEGACFYFVHSYYPVFERPQNAAAHTEYGRAVDVAIERGNLFGVQFHPEKSWPHGLTMLKNFIDICKEVKGECLQSV